MTVHYFLMLVTATVLQACSSSTNGECRVTMELSDVSYCYPRAHRPALSGITARLGHGVVGLLGANGAGKTTLIRLLAGLTAPSSGQIVLGGQHIDSRRQRSQLRTRVGYLPQAADWFGGYTVAEFLHYFAALRGVQRHDRAHRVEALIADVDLHAQANIRLRHLSGGQRQRALIAQALVHQPEVIILDEPTASLDPVHRIEMKKIITTLGQDRLVVLSTHLIDDLMHCAQQILVLHQGHSLWSGTPDELADVGQRHEGRVAASSDAEAGFLSLVNGTYHD